MAQPGDGVCPTNEEFIRVAQTTYDAWMSRFGESHDEIPTDVINDMIELLSDVPPFAPNQQPLSLVSDSEMIHTECISQWITSADADCDKRSKEVRHFETLGYREPLHYVRREDADQLPPWPDFNIKPLETWCHLIYAWAYLLCLRWVELLSGSGEEAYLCQSASLDEMNFWEVICRPWEAVLFKDKRMYFAPWSLSCSSAVRNDNINKE